MESIKDASHLYEVERRARHAERPGFRINELQISTTQNVPWHYHSNIQDTFYVIEGHLRLFLREPDEEVRLSPGDTYSVRPRRPHLVLNDGDCSATFLLLQGMGEYDYVPLASELRHGIGSVNSNPQSAILLTPDVTFCSRTRS